MDLGRNDACFRRTGIAVLPFFLLFCIFHAHEATARIVSAEDDIISAFVIPTCLFCLSLLFCYITGGKTGDDLF